MKRYRWLKFYIDAQRAPLSIPNLPPHEQARITFQFAEMITARYGSSDLQRKLQRWLNIKPPDLCVPVEYHDLLREAEGAYVRGDFYPALTSACCIGERILNHLILGVRSEFRASPRYKEVHRKEMIQNWDLAVGILLEWKCIDDNMAKLFNDLVKMRNPSVHFGNVDARASSSLVALNLAYRITELLFGRMHPRFFMPAGEIYVKKEYENEPVTKHLIIPHCFHVGYKHWIDEKWVIQDKFTYSDRDISDKEFTRLRGKAKNGIMKKKKGDVSHGEGH